MTEMARRRLTAMGSRCLELPERPGRLAVVGTAVELLGMKAAAGCTIV